MSSDQLIELLKNQDFVSFLAAFFIGCSFLSGIASGLAQSFLDLICVCFECIIEYFKKKKIEKRRTCKNDKDIWTV